MPCNQPAVSPTLWAAYTRQDLQDTWLMAGGLLLALMMAGVVGVLWDALTYVPQCESFGPPQVRH